jgi:4-hydroxythreonine-4-phosphate dehydrogenase
LRGAICAIFAAKLPSSPRNKVRAIQPIIVTMGDPCGIGPEVTTKAWSDLHGRAGLCFAVAGDPALYSNVPVVVIDELSEASAVFASALPVLRGFSAENAVWGQPDPRYAGAILSSIDRAVASAQAGEALAVVTAPISKAIVMAAGFSHPGHTEYLGKLLERSPYQGTRGPIMMLAVEGLRVVPVTIHCALQDVARTLTTQAIVNAAKTTAEALSRDFGISVPRLAIAALNPHAGENGAFGDEEARIIAPAIASLQARGIDAKGPYPADTLFHADARRQFDAVICMYHDQALIPLKTLDFWGGVNITLGLPIVRTSPDHGTGFDIAGKGIANPQSMIAAIEMAAFLGTRRTSRS